MRFVCAQGTHLAGKTNFVLFFKKKKVIRIGSLYRFYLSPSAALPLKTFRLQLLNTHCLLKTFKIHHHYIMHYYNATTEI